MTKLFVIPGHGAGDSGATGGGYQEQERVRALATKLKELGGSNVELADFSRNYYADNGISKLNIPKDTQLIELHMDSAAPSARGAHVIINSTFEPDSYDKKLAENITAILPGRANKIVKRSNLANPKRAAAKGYPYRLLETGFISNETDRNIFNNSLDEIARAILDAFNIPVVGGESSPTPEPTPAPTPTPATPSTKSIDEIAKEVIEGKWGNGNDRKNRLTKAGYNYSQVQSRVNQMLGAKPAGKSIDELAREVIDGKWGNGNDRKNRLTAAGYNYSQVQSRVNQLLK